MIEYGGAPKPRRTRWGTIGWEELDDGVLVASQPSGAPTWFPCNDHPFDKASYRIRVETDAAYTVVAIGELEDQRVISGQGEWVYEQREPTASYLVTLQIGRYAQHSLAFDGVECKVHFPRPSSTACAPTSRPCRACSRSSRHPSGRIRSRVMPWS